MTVAIRRPAPSRIRLEMALISSQGWAGPRADRPVPYRVFRMIVFRMILTFTSRITTISGRKIEMMSTSFLLLVDRRGHSPPVFLFWGQGFEQLVHAAA